jgi:hypothetical protein
MDTISTTQKPIHYPETNGKPMAKTDVHIDVLIYLREALRDHYRDAPRVYVAGTMLFYYEEGNPAACVVPDGIVVQGVAKGERRTYRLWEEGQPPAVVFEITSRGTRPEDLGTKRAMAPMPSSSPPSGGMREARVLLLACGSVHGPDRHTSGRAHNPLGPKAPTRRCRP